VIRTLVAEQASSQATKFGVHDGEQLFESFGITGIPPPEKLGDVTHSGANERDSSSTARTHLSRPHPMS
jgi:hypothetical protein